MKFWMIFVFVVPDKFVVSVGKVGTVMSAEWITSGLVRWGKLNKRRSCSELQGQRLAGE